MKSIAQISNNARQLLLIALVLIALIFFYCFLSTKGSFEFREIQDFMNYDMLADALLSGQLSLKQEIDPDRARASDPSDPSLPYPGLVDAIVFNGKYYFLQQPFPAVFHAIWMILTGRSLPTGVAVMITATGCLLLLGLILMKIRDTFFSDSPGWILFIMWLSFALSAAQLYMISRPIFCHETISSGIMFVLLGALLFIYAVTGTRHQTVLFALSGISFGAAGACKANLFIYPFSFLACWFFYFVTKTRQLKYLTFRALFFLSPVIFFVILLLVYNYLRFGAFLDFGRRYSLLTDIEFYEYCCIKGHFFRIGHVVHQLYNYLLALPDIHYGARFTSINFGGIQVSTIGDLLIARQDLVSVFLMMPVLILGLVIPFLPISRNALKGSGLIIACCITSSLVAFGLLTSYAWASARFVYEFTPLLFIVVYCVLANLWETIRVNKRLRQLAIIGIVLLFCANTLMGLKAGIIGFMYVR